MRAIARWCLALVALSSVAVVADDHVVLIDEDVNISSFRTFTVRDVSITSRHPELNSPVMQNVLRDATRTALAGKGLSEVPDRPALIVDCSVRGVDFGIDRTGRPVEESSGRGRRRQPNPNRRAFTEGTLVVDVKRADTGALVWRGVYHDTDTEPSRVAAELPKHAATLLSQFPRQRKP